VSTGAGAGHTWSLEPPSTWALVERSAAPPPLLQPAAPQGGTNLPAARRLTSCAAALQL
jgi:hypothetical protein